MDCAWAACSELPSRGTCEGYHSHSSSLYGYQVLGLNDPGVETDAYTPPQCIAQFSSGHLRLFAPTGVLRETLSDHDYLGRSAENGGPAGWSE